MAYSVFHLSLLCQISFGPVAGPVAFPLPSFPNGLVELPYETRDSFCLPRMREEIYDL
jgi:hypothetical protein